MSVLKRFHSSNVPIHRWTVQLYHRFARVTKEGAYGKAGIRNPEPEPETETEPEPEPEPEPKK